MKSKHTLGPLIFGLLVGALVGCIFGYQLGAMNRGSVCEKKLTYLTEMPKGGLYMDKELDIVWSKTDSQALAFVRIPNPERAQLVRMWSSPVADKPATTTTTTIPAPTEAAKK